MIRFLRVGVGISNADLEYAESTSQTTAPIEGWQTTAPKWRKGYYIWSRTHIYYTDGNEKVSTPMCLSVARSIDRIEECYYSSTSSTAITGGAWAKGKSPAWVSGRFIWTKSIIYFTDGTSTETTPICCTGGQGPQGPQGKPGTPGKDGADAVQYYYHIAWCNTPDNSDNSFSTSCSDGDQYAYMGTCNNTTKEDPEDFSAYEWNKVKGADGAAGKDAINIQMSMPTIVHKKSQFAGTYAIDVRAYKAGVELACSVSVEVPSNYASSVKASVINNGKGKRVIVVIGANIDVYTNLAFAVKVENVTYKYTIPVKTIADGEDGKRGETGATLRGPQSWANCGNGYSFESGASGEEWKDVVIYNSGYYSCIKSHIRTETNFPGSAEDQNNQYWRLGSPIEMVIAKIILSQYQLVDNLGVKVIEMKDENGKMMFLAKGGKVICNGGIFQNISVSGDISVGRLRYNENTVTDGTSVINGSFIRGGGTYVLPHLSDGEFMRIVVFNPIITRSTPLATLKGEQEMDAFMAAGSSFFLNREATIGVYGWCELIGTSQNGHTIWVYSVVENKQN